MTDSITNTLLSWQDDLIADSAIITTKIIEANAQMVTAAKAEQEAAEGYAALTARFAHLSTPERIWSDLHGRLAYRIERAKPKLIGPTAASYATLIPSLEAEARDIQVALAQLDQVLNPRAEVQPEEEYVAADTVGVEDRIVFSERAAA